MISLTATITAPSGNIRRIIWGCQLPSEAVNEAVGKAMPKYQYT
jgi:hypothetical protein